jgi:hypothetical protein
MGRRRVDRQERHHLQCQYSDRGSLHHAALPARQRSCGLVQAAVVSGHLDRQHRGAVRGRPHRRGQSLARRGSAEESLANRRGRGAAGRGGAGAAFVADFEEWAIVLQHAVRRERGLAHRARPVLLEMLHRWRQPDARADRGARRQQEPDSHRLDDRLGRDRHRRHPCRRPRRPGVPQGRVGATPTRGLPINRTSACRNPPRSSRTARSFRPQCIAR